MSLPRSIRLARNLRTHATEAEHALWSALTHCRPRFTRQLPIGPYIADFACRRARVVVEVDGGQHAKSLRDAVRTAALESVGWRVIRFWNPDVLGNVAGVVDAIAAAVEERLPEGERFEMTVSRAGLERVPRSRKKGPPPALPAKAGGE